MTRWNPLHDLVDLQDQMNRLFEDATVRRAGETEAAELERADWSPLADVSENAEEFVVSVDLPGIDRSSLDTSLDENRLVIKGVRTVGSDTLHRRERPHGNFLRTFTVPTTVDQSDIRADYKDGVLQVHLPKRKEQPPQRVEIKVS